MKILILNGPNLNLTGKREPEIYGHETFEDLMTELKFEFRDSQLTYFQSNIEGELIDALQKANQNHAAVVFNPGGYSHTSVAIADALRAMEIPVIEVHLSNIFARESFRHHSLTGAACLGSISGLGMDGYRMAIHYLLMKNGSDQDQ